MDTPEFIDGERPSFTFEPLGDSAVMVRCGDAIDPIRHRWLQGLWRAVQQSPPAGLRDCVPAYTTLTLHYDPFLCVWASGGDETTEASTRMINYLKELLPRVRIDHEAESKLVEIPVCYGGAYGPDLEVVASHCGLSQEDVIRKHSEADYLVYMIGFAPGFPYLGGLPPQLATPRREPPRVLIPAGSVGIAGGQTGVYPLATPGGWQLIGRTPVQLFLPERRPPSLLSSGYRVKFVPVNEGEYLQMSQL